MPRKLARRSSSLTPLAIPAISSNLTNQFSSFINKPTRNNAELRCLGTFSNAARGSLNFVHNRQGHKQYRLVSMTPCYSVLTEGPFEWSGRTEKQMNGYGREGPPTLLIQRGFQGHKSEKRLTKYPHGYPTLARMRDNVYASTSTKMCRVLVLHGRATGP